MENPAPVPIWLGQRGGKGEGLCRWLSQNPAPKGRLVSFCHLRESAQNRQVRPNLAWHLSSPGRTLQVRAGASGGRVWGDACAIFLSSRTQLHTLEQAYCLINETTRGDPSVQIGGNLAPSGQGRISGAQQCSPPPPHLPACLSLSSNSCLARPSRSHIDNWPMTTGIPRVEKDGKAQCATHPPIRSRQSTHHTQVTHKPAQYWDVSTNYWLWLHRTCWSILSHSHAAPNHPGKAL